MIIVRGLAMGKVSEFFDASFEKEEDKDEEEKDVTSIVQSDGNDDDDDDDEEEAPIQSKNSKWTPICI